MRGAVAFSALLLFFLSSPSDAVKLRIARPPKTSSTGPRPPKVDASNNLINKNNERYTANITIMVNVALDTGSTDLWVYPPEGLPHFNDTRLNATLRYGDGSDFVTGDIGVGEFQMAQYTIPFQGTLDLYLIAPAADPLLYIAFLNVDEAASAEDADFDDGIFGLLGLGFNTPGSSGVNDAVQEAYGKNADWGQSVLANIFDQNPGGADYIGIALSRTGDQEETADASLTIAEYDSNYQAVANAPKVLQNPVNSGAWTVTLDGLSVNGKKISWPSTMEEAPPGKNIVHLDTGTTNIMVPFDQQQAIYSAIPGAVFSPDSYIPIPKFSTTYDVWVVPCNATPNVVASFGGQDYPIHPLDVTDIEVITSPDGTTNYTVCVGAFTDVGTIVEGASDALFGDSFLRNVYSVFDFGTGGGNTQTPFVQLLSVTDSTKSPQDLVSVRLAAMKNMPPEIDPLDLVKIFNLTEKPFGGAPSTPSGAVSFAPSILTSFISTVSLLAFISVF
ncbi:aspartic peptidase domain-containing protein [Mycena pura]|uniref:Aspartic peptidase domain-containing protein n=1 Tax=Mycena pura TaxID=153505 RepID=A0AAD6YL17_9AGAR|nr:aspartic peptidase domain-containing protein [Mycena pura]